MENIERKRKLQRQPSGSNNEGGGKDVVVDKKTMYLQEPKEEEFDFNITNEFLKGVKEDDPSVVSTLAECEGLVRVLNENNVPNKYIEYTYNVPIKFVYISNCYGLCINDCNDSPDETIDETIDLEKALGDRFTRLFLRLPNMKHNWHKDSNQLFTKIFDDFFEDLQKIPDKLRWQKLSVSTFMLKDMIEDIRKQLLTGAMINKKESVLSVFGIPLSLTQNCPKKITSVILEFGSGKLLESDWTKFTEPSYMHALHIIKFSGCKIDKSKISINWSIDCLIAKKCKSNQKALLSVYLRQPVVQKKKNKNRK